MPQTLVSLCQETESVISFLAISRRLFLSLFSASQPLTRSWQEQTVRLPLAGNLARVEARGLFVYVQIGNLEPVRLAFAWVQASQIPLILGQTNFFRQFDVCFQRSRCTIEIIRF